MFVLTALKRKKLISKAIVYLAVPVILIKAIDYLFKGNKLI